MSSVAPSKTISRSAMAVRRTALAPQQAKPSIRLVPARRGAFVRVRAQEGGAEGDGPAAATETASPKSAPKTVTPQVAKEINKIANTMAPRASGAAKKNPAVPGSLLYQIFDVQAWLAVVVGGLLSFNVLFPSDEPDIARLMGMWSIFMFTVPALRARECNAKEKEALNILFLLIPLLNVTLPLAWKSFAFVYSADVVALFGVMYWKVWGASEEEAPKAN